jgi:hypothetical protein
MEGTTAYYFVRPNGAKMLHNDPAVPHCYVPGEPPAYPKRSYNYLAFCLQHGIARIGWPDTGDLAAGDKSGALATCYSLDTIRPYQRKYLLQFRDIAVGSVVLSPDKEAPGDLCMGEVTKRYHYYHSVPEHPYECAHRIGVKWDRGRDGQPVRYTAAELGIVVPGGFWRRAFHRIDVTQKAGLIRRIETVRRQRRGGAGT